MLLFGVCFVFSDFCNRYILYVRCFLPKIHLIVIFIVENLYEIKDYYASMITALYNFLKKNSRP